MPKILTGPCNHFNFKGCFCRFPIRSQPNRFCIFYGSVSLSLPDYQNFRLPRLPKFSTTFFDYHNIYVSIEAESAQKRFVSSAY